MRNIAFITIILLSTFWSSLATAQTSSVNIDGKEQKEVIDSVSLLLNNNYVFPEVAKKMTDLIQDKYKKGLYNSVVSVASFADKLTEDLRSVSKDKHLRVNFNPNAIKQMRENAQKGNQGISPDALENYRMENFGFKEVKLMEGNVGYLDLRGFVDAKLGSETAIAAMNFLSNASALIVDLRNNGGGSPSMIQLITSYLYGPEPVHLNSFYYRPTNENTQTWTLANVQGKRRPDIDVYVLTSPKTFSAAEEFTYNLKNLKRATIIGETTGGGAHPGGSRIATERFTVWVPTGRAINPITKTNWEGTGVKPDIEVKAADALITAHVKALQDLVLKTSGPLRQRYEWPLTSLQSKKEPVKIEEATLKSFVGTYGEKRIVFEDSNLYFFPFPDMKVKLTPLSKDFFAIGEMKNVRLKMLYQDNAVTGIEEVFDNGKSDKHLKKDIVRKEM